MNFLSILASIFVEEDASRDIVHSAPKNLTHHYRDDLPNLFLDEVWVATEYKISKFSIEKYKYQSDREYLENLVALYLELYKENRDILSKRESWSIVPVPMHWSRYMIRGFDHMRLIALELSEKLDIQTISPLRTNYRPRQSMMKRSSRLANKKNAFTIQSGFSTLPDNIILIDDVISSGSTANACAEVLKKAGVKRVISWFIASNN